MPEHCEYCDTLANSWELTPVYLKKTSISQPVYLCKNCRKILREMFGEISPEEIREQEELDYIGRMRQLSELKKRKPVKGKDKKCLRH